MSAAIAGWVRRGLAAAAALLALGLIAFVSLDMVVVVIVAGLGVQLLSVRLMGASREAVRTAHEELRRLCAARWGDLQAVPSKDDGDQAADRRKKEGRDLIRQIRTLQKQIQDAPREAQMKSFLEKFPLLKDSVAGIGPSRITQLASFGIESSADIERDAILAVPGFGPQLADRLCQWRDALKTRFRFSPAAPVRAAGMRRLTRELQEPLERFRQACQRASCQVQILDRRLVSVTKRLAAHDAAIGAAVHAAADAEANCRAGRLLPVLSAYESGVQGWQAMTAQRAAPCRAKNIAIVAAEPRLA